MVAVTHEQMATLRASPALASDLMFADQEDGSELRIAGLGKIETPLDLQKSWHILHYVFTGDIGPVGSPGDGLMAGEDLGDDITGYGPPRLLSPEDTKLFADFLKSLNLETLQSRANFETMSAAHVYALPMGPGAEADFEVGIRGEIASYFPALRDYVSKAAGNGNGLLMWLT
jgi:Domain of unknown function (DUF1877)